ncbi:peroxiredoxin [Dictyobacter arantiisoli]|uniref:thioredoxin-dependent peroxiredoxin n=1 Tax=Dictyobacter arantiisoli TaxID=2014874 RepID=A0A5A5TC42_9CHLR|nr:peroxiredoxin [Dictyobacter arantiisoli]GCF08716.1 peroxiredoxin [Dictyobacter arantiisoli]
MSTQAADGGIKVGDIAPDFSLPTQDGKQVSLKDFQGKEAVVLYFYPKDDTPGCTAEACTFRDSYEAFKDVGAEVIGISSDDTASHQQFASKYKLPFILVSDNGAAVRKRYGVKDENTEKFGVLPGRVTFVIGKDGIVLHVFSSLFSPEKHITEAITILKANDK